MTVSTQQRITDAQWCAIEATLPATADQVLVRETLERIAHDRTPPGKLAAEYEDQVRGFNSGLAALRRSGTADTAVVAELTQQREAAKKQARLYRSIGRVKRPHFLLHCRIIWLWLNSGGELAISTPRRKAPYGPVIPYFRAAAAATLGKTPSPYRVKNIVQTFRRLNIRSERWGGVMGVYIDDSKVFIIPAPKQD
jgi:hypothetical protein